MGILEAIQGKVKQFTDKGNDKKDQALKVLTQSKNTVMSRLANKGRQSIMERDDATLIEFGERLVELAFMEDSASIAHLVTQAQAYAQHQFEAILNESITFAGAIIHVGRANVIAIDKMDSRTDTYKIDGTVLDEYGRPTSETLSVIFVGNLENNTKASVFHSANDKDVVYTAVNNDREILRWLEAQTEITSTIHAMGAPEILEELRKAPKAGPKRLVATEEAQAS